MRTNQTQAPPEAPAHHAEEHRVHTASWVRAFVLRTFGGYHVFRTECVPKFSALGGIAYSKTWWLRRD
ncbi:MAG: hypothetical protein GY851_36170 [bacterium]|nr:hypothetical protein [bacterium]